MKKADLKVGSTYIYCRDVDGPRAYRGRYGGIPHYEEAVVLDVDWKGVYRYTSDAAERKRGEGVFGASSDGILIEVQQRDYSHKPMTAQKMVLGNARRLYDDDLAELDALWEQREADRAERRQREREEQEREVIRHAKAVNRIRALGIECKNFPLTIEQVEALLDRAEDGL